MFSQPHSFHIPFYKYPNIQLSYSFSLFIQQTTFEHQHFSFSFSENVFLMKIDMLLMDYHFL